MKAKLSKADIIVANHALLLSDVLINQENDPAYRVLPVYSHLVVDEAHSFIKECFDRFSLRFSYYRNMDLLHILHNKDKKTRRGYLTHLQSNYAQLADLLGAARVLAERAEKLTRGYFASLNEVVKYRDDYSFHHVLTPADRNRPGLEYD
jgi:ATP-dependent DNA helicase DinG